jgi:hypothetical protein
MTGGWIAVMITVLIFNIFCNHRLILLRRQYHVRVDHAGRINDVPRTNSAVVAHTATQDRQTDFTQFAFVEGFDIITHNIEIGEGVTRSNKGIASDHTKL